MNIPKLAVARPTFITCLVLLIFFAGLVSQRKLPVSLFPETDVPFISISTIYPGAGPKEIELSISKYLEDELSTVEGLKKVSAISQDSLSLVWVEFRTGMNLDAVEQRVRDRVSLARNRFPREAEAPIVERFNPSNQPVITVFLSSAEMNRIQLTSWAEQDLKPALARIPKVGRIDIVGGQKRQIDVVIDPKKIDAYRLPLLQVASALQGTGANVPAGSLSFGSQEIALRSFGQFNTLTDINNKVVAFGSGETPIRVKDLGRAEDSSVRVKSKAFYKGQQGVLLQVYRQTGANTIAVADAVKQEIQRIDSSNAKNKGPSLTVVRDGSKMIRDNIADVWESIVIGVILTIVVVYFFLGSMRSTLITGFAIPNSLLGAFILMGIAGFSVNILTLLALSLCVGLLVDDAIVVRENIFKHMERGEAPKVAAVEGANEVAMAVVAVTAAILAMFGPVGFLSGVTGQFFREFGLVICFAVMVSLFDAMAVAPMLSAYWGGGAAHHGFQKWNPFHYLVKGFDHFQTLLEKGYAGFLRRSMRWPLLTMATVAGISVGLMSTASHLPSGFLPADQSREFNVKVNLPAGYNLESSYTVAKKIDEYLAKHRYVDYTVLTVGNANQELHKADVYVKLKSQKQRDNLKASDVRDVIRKELAELKGIPKQAQIFVIQTDITGGGFRPFTMVVQTKHMEELAGVAARVFELANKHPDLISPDMELRPGGQELQVKLIPGQAERFGVNAQTVGMEMRARLEGLEVAKLREDGYEYDIKLKTNEAPNIWLERRHEILVPNINMTPVDLRKVASFERLQSPAKIERVNRAYSARITADLQQGASIAHIMEDFDQLVLTLENEVPGVSRIYEGDAESFTEMSESMSMAFLFGVILLFLVLASLYESFLMSFLNIITLPLAVSGAFLSLYLLKEGLNIYSVIGILLLLGVATKNSILLIDTAIERLKSDHDDFSLAKASDDILQSSVRRLRPILMTSLALIAGCVPIAIGLNEASAQRTGMGVAIVGGTLTSTLFTLVLVPSMILFVEKMKHFIRGVRKPQLKE